MSRFGLKTRTALVFALVFAVFAVAAASANYVLLRRSLGEGRGLPSVEALSSALQEVAADGDRSLPEFVSSADGAQLLLNSADPGAGLDSGDSSSELFPLVGRTLEGGILATEEIDRWLAARNGSVPGRFELELSDEDIPADGAAFDVLVLRALASLEPRDPGVTSDLLGHISSLRVEGGGRLFFGANSRRWRHLSSSLCQLRTGSCRTERAARSLNR